LLNKAVFKAIHVGIPTFDPKVEPTSIALRWRRWKRAFKLFVVGNGTTDKTQKRVLMLHCAGMDVQDIFYTLPVLMLHCAGMDVQDIFYTLPANGNANDYDKAIEALDTYFNPAVNVPYERHMFRRTSREESETIDQFVTRLKQKSLSCDYGSLVMNSSEIKSSINVIQWHYEENCLKEDKL
jgi:hypothetical protein